MQGRETNHENTAGIRRTAEDVVNVQAVRDTGIGGIVGTRTEVEVIMNGARVLRANLVPLETVLRM